MLFFRGISLGRMIRVLLPYLLGLLAVLAVLGFYLKVTGEVAARTAESAEDKAVQVSWELSRMAADSTTAALMFMAYSHEDMLFRRLKPDFTELLGLDDFTLVTSMTGTFGIVPFGGDSLFARAVTTGDLQLRRGEGAEIGCLTVFFPTTSDSGSVSSVSRMELPASVESISFDSYRYAFFMLAAAVIVLIIVPAIILRLADLRRRSELTGLSREDTPGWKPSRPSGTEKSPRNTLPSLFADSRGTPALIRLDDGCLILELNSQAQELLDISAESTEGMDFRQIPGLGNSDGTGFEPGDRLPERLNTGSLRIQLEDSSGRISQVLFTSEQLEDGGWLLAGHSEGSGVATVTSLSSASTEAGPLPVIGVDSPVRSDGLKRILTIAEEGREYSPAGSRAAGMFARICELAELPGAAGTAPSLDSGGIELTSELERIAVALNDVLPERASVEVDSPGLLPEVRCTRQDLTQIVKNMVFYSLESVPGQVRIRLIAREVPSPGMDSIFSARCDRSVGRSVGLSFSDGTRMPVRLKEALLDPDTDTSGISRDFGSHVASAAEVISGRGCFPTVTEGVVGTTLHILFQTTEESLFDLVEREGMSISGKGISAVIADASKAVRDGVSQALVVMGADTAIAADLDQLDELLDQEEPDWLILDTSLLEGDAVQTVTALREKLPRASIVVTARSSRSSLLDGISGRLRLVVLPKPYSPHELIQAATGLARSNPPVEQ